MHFQFLIEDMSGGILIEQVMQKIIDNIPKENRDITYDLKTFHGIGGFKKRCSPKDTKTQKLLNDLPIFLRGFDKKLNVQGYKAALIIVLDNDKNDPAQFHQELKDMAKSCMVTIDHVFCIAIEEMEAWLLGDRAALVKAYPNARISVLDEYEQDSICGTWEKLANIVYPGGLQKFQKECSTYRDIGIKKCEWAKNIGENMDIHNNKSPSFCNFINALESRILA